MNWDEYRDNCKRWRMKKDSTEYLAILLLGIREEYDEFIEERKSGSVERQIEEYGDMLYNIADLINYLEENYISFRDVEYTGSIFVPRKCVEVVRKYYMRDCNYEKFIAECWNIADISYLEYVVRSNTAGYALDSSYVKMSNRHG